MSVKLVYENSSLPQASAPVSVLRQIADGLSHIAERHRRNRARESAEQELLALSPTIRRDVGLADCGSH